MPAFRYEAIDKAGSTSKGVLNADSARAARSELRAQGLLPVTVEAIHQHSAAGEEKKRAFFAERLSTVELALFTRQLASLLEAGLPLEQSLSALLDQSERTFIRDIIASIRSEVMAGAALSDALKQHPHDFADIYCALVASGEQIGHLARVLSRLADYIERRNALVQKVKLAFTYPAIVTVVAFAIVIFLLTYVVPQIVSVFANTKQKLPFLTVMMLAISDFVRVWGWLVGLLLIAAFTLWRVALRNPELKLAWHTWLLTAPVYGKFERSLNTARFASTLAITTGSGVPILQALQTSRETLSNVAMRAQVEEATASVREGVGLARALSAHKHFPPMLIHMIRAGEVTGELPAMLERASNAQEQDLERRALTIAGLLEPVLILAMGGVVLLIVLAVLMPIIEINQLVR
ncbi:MULTISPECIES: type II secretion system inner membrane protein GspF [unclassified Undibacterium]|uniref:type II secretion system inner membrane protein GspF n=1 Tax=unclassified Undibacterium TaxID=2630295 RepID=UPI002AC92672|nr:MULTISPECIES: type II secretion system inner membrane protein GspF [unclassified Undibacterium]MEB0138347.1 type II secretion system inner membrane protein GspF [Undibacterium sp. CCC2.1]MEB0172724.1 type II secretion system inner membrane protein GspF [Undibacterium sp. CCC1.1]MEB0174722.1 type II secretion system inner membrane protein GspF [Undibacterium sp. CCC3.4]MEB0213919.1 type II secretion system inner membrane protein GspF [Undibacterium sp. 5I2]WPX42643.1 type II secretion system